MAQQRVSDDQAFDLLRRASQRMNVKLRILAMLHAASRRRLATLGRVDVILRATDD